jgi:hypothetical protein
MTKNKKPSYREFCEKCPVFKNDIPPSRFGCCLHEPTSCPKSGSCNCCYEIDPPAANHKKDIRGFVDTPDVHLTPLFQSSKHLSEWICPECGKHTETELTCILSRWAKRRCKTCNFVFFGIKFFEENKEKGST